MKRLFTLLATVTIVYFAAAQNLTGTIPVEINNTANTHFDFQANAGQLVEKIVNKIGLKPNFRIKAAKVENVQAVIRHGQRYIKYNPAFINSINKRATDQWASVFILAHEIGHHLDGHTALKKNQRSSAIELEADEFAGFVMYKMGATLDQAKLSVMYIANPVASKTHPGTADRIAAVERGWRKSAVNSQ